MLLKILKKNQILLFVLLFLISLSIMLLTKKSDEANLIEKENTTLKNIPKIVTQVQKKVESNERNSTIPEKLAKDFLLNTPTLDNKIDFIGTSEPLIYSEPQLEIEQIMQEHQKPSNSPARSSKEGKQAKNLVITSKRAIYKI